MIEWLNEEKDFESIKKKNKKFFMLLFYADFSSAAKRSLSEIKKFSKENKQVPVYIIDVQKVSGIHKQFEVKNVPTVLVIQDGKVTKKIEGVESAKYYSYTISGIHSSRQKKGKKTGSLRVVVYVGPGCPACGTAKNYLKRQGVPFREVDISRDQYAAKRLARRSGQMAVPQIDINGYLVVGFDKAKIDRLLSI
ncbi:MAG TPA: thioredoxin family protein [Acidobacteriota bacterium]|nr:thioredoxin family protein [Acidobacteriota bacterium]